MKMIHGQISSVSKENPTIAGCTISNTVYERDGVRMTHFSMGKGTDISAESYPHDTLFFVESGEVEIFDLNGFSAILKEREVLIMPKEIPFGVRAVTNSVYTEISQRKEIQMNQLVKKKEVFKVAELVPYQEGKIVNMDVLSNEHMKYVIMAFDDGCALSEHAAPGEAIVTALDGEAEITYEGEKFLLHAGENFVFEKGGLHKVRANGRFKMSLLLML